MPKQYEIPLRLVTPHMKGQKVKDAQYLMAGHNRFANLATYKDGEIDGDYGPVTAQATARAKYWLGYPKTSIDSVFGQRLYEFIRPNDWRPLPETYRQRRADRLKAVEKTDNAGMRAFKLAEKEIGYREEPRHGINDNKFGRWYGWNYVAWCAIFESWCFAHSSTKRYHYAAVEAIYWAAASNRNGMYIVRTPRKGDIVGYTIHGDPFAHTAFFDHWIDSGSFVDLGGNTGPTSISNGGMVMKQTRPKSMVRFFARVS